MWYRQTVASPCTYTSVSQRTRQLTAWFTVHSRADIYSYRQSVLGNWATVHHIRHYWSDPSRESQRARRCEGRKLIRLLSLCSKHKKLNNQLPIFNIRCIKFVSTYTYVKSKLEIYLVFGCLIWKVSIDYNIKCRALVSDDLTGCARWFWRVLYKRNSNSLQKLKTHQTGQ